MALHASLAQAEAFGDFLGGESAEEAGHHDAGPLGVDLLQGRDGLVDEQHLVVLVGRGDPAHRARRRAQQIPAVPQAALAPRVVDQDVPHGRGGHREKVAPVPPAVVVARQSEPGLVHQHRGLQGRVLFHARHLGARQPPQLRIYVGMHHLEGRRRRLGG